MFITLLRDSRGKKYFLLLWYVIKLKDMMMNSTRRSHFLGITN